MPLSPAPLTERLSRKSLSERFRAVRGLSVSICDPLEIEDWVVQTMPDVSPPKWNLAHTAWFFETFLLKPEAPNYRDHHPLYNYLFNSYYEAVGERHPRPDRGLLSRPTVAEVLAYRRYVDEAMLELLDSADEETFARIAPIVELGLHHEQQHQELLLTDLKHILASNPLNPVYCARAEEAPTVAPKLGWKELSGGVAEIGFEGEGFHFDNEGPRHRALLEPFALADRLVTNGEFLEFIEDGGYRTARHWLSLGWATVLEHGWEAPFYWRKVDGEWRELTLAGLRPLDPGAPVCHLSYFEADAFAAWTGYRLPTEAEWETAAAEAPIEGNLLDDWRLHPAAAARSAGLQQSVGLQQSGLWLRQLFGDVWEWTASPYVSYPGYRAPEGAIGEYNGKFMCNQFVLRGGSALTPADHIRPTYRNFFPPEARWQLSGVRLARDL